MGGRKDDMQQLAAQRLVAKRAHELIGLMAERLGVQDSAAVVSVMNGLIKGEMPDGVGSPASLELSGPVGGFQSPDRGLWVVQQWAGSKVVLQSDDFKHDVALEINGDFEELEQKREYATALARWMNWMLVFGKR